MTTSDWHVPEPLLARFVDDPASLDTTAAASAEAHLLACARCRHDLHRLADPTAIDHSWEGVADLVDRPRTGLVERLLERVGVHGGWGRLLAATPGLRLAGLLAIALVATGAAVASRVAEADGPFLVVAPILPLAAVAVSFAAQAEPAGEAAVATPLWGAGLVLRRTVAVLGITFAMLAIASLVAPAVDAGSLGWVLPGLALGLGALALTTWVRAETAVAVLAAAWIGIVFSARWQTGRDAAFVDSIVFEPLGQLAALLAACVATTLVLARRSRFSTLESFR